jgi:Rrf2 family transcriptional regulator, cysteine metabolism repressor
MGARPPFLGADEGDAVGLCKRSLPVMKLPRTIMYAIDAALMLARRTPGVSVPSGELAREGKMPERFLLQVLRCLVKHDILCSTRGAEGGYFLAREASCITLRDIFEAFDGSLEVSLPTPRYSTWQTDTFLLTALQNAARAARDELQKVTLADLLRGDAGEFVSDIRRHTLAASTASNGIECYSATDCVPLGEPPIGSPGGNGRIAI